MADLLGDVTGPPLANEVTGILGKALPALAGASSDEVLYWTGTAWAWGNAGSIGGLAATIGTFSTNVLVTFTGAITGSTVFTVTLNGQTTADITYSTVAATAASSIQTAINNLGGAYANATVNNSTSNGSLPSATNAGSFTVNLPGVAVTAASASLVSGPGGVSAVTLNPGAGALLSYEGSPATWANQPVVDIVVGAPWTGVDISGATDTTTTYQALVTTYGPFYRLVHPDGGVAKLTAGNVVVPQHCWFWCPSIGLNPQTFQWNFSGGGTELAPYYGFILGNGTTVLNYDVVFEGGSINQNNSSNIGDAVFCNGACKVKLRSTAITGSWQVGVHNERGFHNNLYDVYIELTGPGSQAGVWCSNADTDVCHFTNSHIELSSSATAGLACVLIDGCATLLINSVEGEAAGGSIGSWDEGCTVTNGATQVADPSTVSGYVGVNALGYGYPLGTTIASTLGPLINFTGSISGGTFTLDLNGTNTGAITWSGTAATLASRIQTAVQAVSGFGSTTVTNLSGAAGDIFELTGTVPALTTAFSATSSLTGTGAAVTATVNLTGGTLGGFVTSTAWTGTTLSSFSVGIALSYGLAVCHANGLEVANCDYEETGGIYVGYTQSPLATARGLTGRSGKSQNIQVSSMEELGGAFFVSSASTAPLTSLVTIANHQQPTSGANALPMFQGMAGVTDWISILDLPNSEAGLWNTADTTNGTPTGTFFVVPSSNYAIPSVGYVPLFSNQPQADGLVPMYIPSGWATAGIFGSPAAVVGSQTITPGTWWEASGTISLTLPSTTNSAGPAIAITNVGSGTITLVGTVSGTVNPTIATQYETVIIGQGTGATWYWIVPPPVGGPPTGAAGGDLSGSYPNPSVHQLYGNALTSAGAANLAKIGQFTTPLNYTASGATTITTPTSALMAGLGTHTEFTPSAGGNGTVKVTITGAVDESSGSVLVDIWAYYGLVSGGVPANGAAASGTQIGSEYIVSNAATQAVPFAWCAILSLVAGDNYWFDLAGMVSANNVVFKAGLTFVIEEVI